MISKLPKNTARKMLLISFYKLNKYRLFAALSITLFLRRLLHFSIL